ncbi:MAG: ferritin [Tissierellia bacterium]|nr:ferritin [Tissierellia bacterium]
MTINNELLEKLQKQFAFELESGYIYLDYAGYAADRDMNGISHFFIEQAKEEYEHAMKFFDYLNEIGHRVEFPVINGSKAEFETFTELFEAALAHEKEVTRRIHELMDIAVANKDYPTMDFLNWFITEQREEEDSFNGLVAKFKGINEKFQGLYLLDKELSYRE